MTQKQRRNRGRVNCPIPPGGAILPWCASWMAFPPGRRGRPLWFIPLIVADNAANADADGDVIQVYVQPTSQDYNHQSHYHLTPDPMSLSSSSTALSSIAHFAKALRMLSFDLDRILDGGNALPSGFTGGIIDRMWRRTGEARDLSR
mmetsp:Transcript_30264/g.62460  ORF Transcript_30264/g.62460 Transcript_30264/m.62460 type:complete len:147 (+) Transcript_30264:977-1417(+)